MPRKKHNWVLVGLWMLLLSTGLVLLALPLWFPWVVRPILLRFGVRYGSYERQGMGGFVLHQVSFTNDTVHLQAATIQGRLPLNWMLRLGLRSNRGDFLTANHWELRWLAKPTGGVSSPISGAGEPTSTYRLVQETASNLGRLNSWLPQAHLSQGTLLFDSKRLIVPSADWQNGLLSAALLEPASHQTATVRARLPGALPWQGSVHLMPFDVQLTFSLAKPDSGMELRGDVLWQTNHLVYSARFGQKAIWPEVASADCPSFRIPAALIGLAGYEDLAGSVSLAWTAPLYRVKLWAQASPRSAGAKSLPPVAVDIAAAGNTEQVDLQRANLDLPWLQARLSKEVAFDFSGKPLTGPASLTLTADLSKQPFIPAAGRIHGVAILRSAAGRFPDLSLALQAEELEIAQVQSRDLAIDADLAWPQLKIERAFVQFPEGGSGTLAAEVDLASRFVNFGRLDLHGKVGESLLTESLSYDGLELHADFAGAFRELHHGGELTVSGLRTGLFTPLQIHAAWGGRGSDLGAFQAQLHSGSTSLLVTGSSQSETGPGGLRFEQFDLTKNGQSFYVLERPFAVSLEKDRPRHRRGGPLWHLSLEPFRWRGSGTSLSVEAGLAWPIRGHFTLSLSNLQTATLTSLLEKELPPVTLKSCIMTGGWTNGPLLGAVEAELDYSAKNHTAFGASMSLRAGLRGLAIERLEITEQSAPVVSGNGLIAIRLDPAAGSDFVRIDHQQPMSLRAATLPNQAFWDEISSWIGVHLVNPRVQLNISGPLTAPEGEVRAEIDAIRTEAQPTNGPLPEVENVGVDLRLNHSAVQLTRLHLLLAKQALDAAGQIPFGTDWSTDWKRFFRWREATGSVSVAQAEIGPLARLLPEMLSPQGKLAMHLALRPDLQFNGALEVQGAATRPLPSIGSVQNLDMQVGVSGRQVTLNSFAGLIGGQPFALTGSVDFSRLSPKTGLPLLDLRIRGDQIPLARRPEVILRSDLNLHVSNQTNDAVVISGLARLRDSVFLSDLSVLKPGKVATPQLRPPYFSIETEPLAGCRLNVHVQGDRFLKIQSPFFRGVASTDLHIEGSLREPMALGEVTVNSGQVEFPFASLDVSQALVSLTSADPYRPRLYAIAASKAFGYDVRMEVAGTADTPIIQFTSTPPLSSEQILLMLSAGEVPQGETAISAQQRASRLALFLGKNLLSEFTDIPGGADRLTVRSGEYLSEQGQQTYSLEYRLSKRWSIVGEYDRFGAFNAGLKWKVYSH